jgi:large conductance mechanosensitive channel
VRGFIEFLKQYGVLALAIAVIIGGKLNAVVTALVDGVLMPVIAFFVPGGDWRSAVVQVGPIRLLFGPFVAAMIDFLIVALLVYWFYSKVLRQAAPSKG